eukprot:s3506_g4.t1
MSQFQNELVACAVAAVGSSSSDKLYPLVVLMGGAARLWLAWTVIMPGRIPALEETCPTHARSLLQSKRQKLNEVDVESLAALRDEISEASGRHKEELHGGPFGKDHREEQGHWPDLGAELKLGSVTPGRRIAPSRAECSHLVFVMVLIYVVPENVLVLRLLCLHYLETSSGTACNTVCDKPSSGSFSAVHSCSSQY